MLHSSHIACVSVITSSLRKAAAARISVLRTMYLRMTALCASVRIAENYHIHSLQHSP